VTIRDAQIEEKKRMMLEAEEESRRQDLLMEVERIRALEQYELREQQRVEERRKGARVLEDQIQERERERIRQEELRDQERIIMLRELERMKEEELTAAVEKKLAAAALMKEVANSNAEQIARKEVMKVRACCLVCLSERGERKGRSVQQYVRRLLSWPNNGRTWYW
jgi:hypothetical protein